MSCVYTKYTKCKGSLLLTDTIEWLGLAGVGVRTGTGCLEKCPNPEAVQGQAGWGPGLPCLVSAVPAHDKGVGTG